MERPLQRESGVPICAMGGHGSTKDGDAHSQSAPPPSLPPPRRRRPRVIPSKCRPHSRAIIFTSAEEEWQTTREVIVKVQVTERTFPLLPARLLSVRPSVSGRVFLSRVTFLFHPSSKRTPSSVWSRHPPPFICTRSASAAF